jgi:hypothetical protein
MSDCKHGIPIYDCCDICSRPPDVPAGGPPPTAAQIMADPRVKELADELENEAISHEEESEYCSENGNDSGRVYHSNRAKKLRSLLAQLKEPKI